MIKHRLNLAVEKAVSVLPCLCFFNTEIVYRDNIMDSKKYHILYRITNVIDNKYYIGIHSTNDIFDGYMGSGVYLNSAFKKYGINNFNKEIIQFFDSRNEMYQAEANFIGNAEINDPNCYNIQYGGIKRKNNPTSDLKTSLSKKGMVPCKHRITGKTCYITMEEFSKGMYCGMSKGIIRSMETKERISKSKIGIIICRIKGTEEIVRLKNGEFDKDIHCGLTAGVKWSNASPLKGRTKENDASIARLAEKRKGDNKHNCERVRKHSEAMRGRTKENNLGMKRMSEKLTGKRKQTSDYVFQASLAKSKGIYITPLGCFYSSMDAASALGCTPTRIINACLKNNNKTFTMSSYSQSGGWFSCFSKYVGKTYKEMGFYFASFPSGFNRKKIFANPQRG